MKQIYIFLLISIIISCKSTEKTNGYGEIDRTCRKYEDNITFVHNRFDPVLKVTGKWRKLSMNSEYYFRSKKNVSVTNDYNEILHLLQTNSSLCKICVSGDSINRNHHLGDVFLNTLKRKISIWKDYGKYSIELLETNEESYAIYFLTDELEKKCLAFGIKNEIVYEFTLLNSKKDKKVQAQFLSNLFKLN